MGRVEQKGGVADGGLDLIVHGRDGRTGVECKHQPNTSVGRPVVQKLHSALITHRLAGGMVITTGRYTAEARECAREISREIPIELLDMGRLAGMAQRAGIRLEAWKGDPAALCLPATDAAGLRAMLTELLAPVESHPAPAGALLACVAAPIRRGWQVDVSPPPRDPQSIYTSVAIIPYAGHKVRHNLSKVGIAV